MPIAPIGALLASQLQISWSPNLHMQKHHPMHLKWAFLEFGAGWQGIISNLVSNILKMATSYTSDSEEDVQGQNQSVQRGKQGRDITDGGNGPLVAGAIAGAIGVALVAVGSAIFIKRKRKSEKKATPSKDRRRVREGGPRKVPPRRPRSVASSTDVGFSKMSQR